ncbi:MAG: hypothetical protein KC445_10500 [Anaerolineales bacterium]|nr:hypothetical protein [Anaerolineales bacterium]
MKIFALFTVVSFILGIYIWRQPQKQRVAAVVVFCLFISFIYFFMNQI